MRFFSLRKGFLWGFCVSVEFYEEIFCFSVEILYTYSVSFVRYIDGNLAEENMKSRNCQDYKSIMVLCYVGWILSRIFWLLHEPMPDGAFVLSFKNASHHCVDHFASLFLAVGANCICITCMRMIDSYDFANVSSWGYNNKFRQLTDQHWHIQGKKGWDLGWD